MAEKTPTQLFFDEIIKEIHTLLKPLGFKKKALNFYRLKDGFHQLINVQKSAYNSADEIGFTMEICIGIAKEGDSPFPSKFDLAIRERIGSIKEDSDIWYELNGYADIFRRKQAFEHTKQAILNDIKTAALPFFDKMNNTQTIENYYGE